METTVLEIAARAAGVLPSAVEDAVRRLHGHFAAQADPSPELISQQLTVLRQHAPHLFPRPSQTDAAGVPGGIPPEVWRGLSPATKLSWAREHQPLPVVERRPTPLTLSAEQAAALAQMTPSARLDAYRQLQAQQQRP
jgi:hypothetical protein